MPREPCRGYDGPIFVTNAPQYHRACWHVPPKRDTDRTTRPNHASRPAPPALLIIDSVSAVITANSSAWDMGVVSRVFVEVGWRRGLGAGSRELKAERQNKGRDVDAGGNAAREGERDACGGRGAHFLVVRH